jgi:hypothetical protein
MQRLRDMLTEQPDMQAIEAHLDSLDEDRRVEEIRALGRSHQARLFAAAEGYRPISLDQMVPADRGPMQEVVHLGKNSLPFFNHFAKVFVRPGFGEQTELWGYNRAGRFIETVVGPGYFLAHSHEVPGELFVDYLRLPPDRPAHWPEILPNSARLSRFVYCGTQDVLRGVSRHVTIGRATKGGEPMSAWFVLCRRDGP